MKDCTFQLKLTWKFRLNRSLGNKKSQELKSTVHWHEIKSLQTQLNFGIIRNQVHAKGLMSGHSPG